jgi:hypothetical protein
MGTLNKNLVNYCQHKIDEGRFFLAMMNDYEGSGEAHRGDVSR